MLLHICCAPDATVPFPELLSEGYCAVGFFYGGNIYPEEEYLKRKEAVSKFIKEIFADSVIYPYSPNTWLEETKSYADEPEGGKRCRKCFEIQLECAAKHAEIEGFKYLSTTLTISPHKDPDLINSIGSETALRHGLVWIEKIWRRNNGFLRSVTESKRLNLYRQNYCGCIYSVRKEDK